MNQRTENLRYLDAESVRVPEGNLAGFRVCTEDAEPIGAINGVLISPAARQLRYFVIEKPGLLVSRRYLLPADAGATVERNHKMLRIDARKDEVELEAFNPRSVPPFSDNDLLDALFAHA